MEITFKHGHFEGEGESRRWTWLPPEVHEVTLEGNSLSVDGKKLPLIHDYSWAYKLQKTQIKTTYEPEKFLQEFFVNTISYTTWAEIIIHHVLQYGK